MTIEETVKKVVKKATAVVEKATTEIVPEVVIERTPEVTTNPILEMGFAQAAARRVRELAGT